MEKYLHAQESSIYMYDLKMLYNLYDIWKKVLPNVQPFYAVKCNGEQCIVSSLADAGANFDCASPSEIDQVLKLGVHPDRIIYANPCKTKSDILFAIQRDVKTTTFDSLCELDKIHSLCPTMNVVLRIYASDPTATCILSNKYGAIESEWNSLLEHAKEKNMNIIGISFHIGSGAHNPEAFRNALRQSKVLYTMAVQKYGFNIHVIDIGGGFTTSNIEMMAATINESLETIEFPGCCIIAEPGRYFAETCADLYTKIIGVRERQEHSNDSQHIHYTISDSLYGSFNNILYDHALPIPVPFIDTQHGHINVDELFESTIWGSTCDGMDMICEKIMLPRLECDMWLRWDNMGAYTISGACDFNGIQLTKPRKYYIHKE